MTTDQNDTETGATGPLLDAPAVLAAIYDVILRRPADPDGLRYWVGALSDGIQTRTPADALAGMLSDFLGTQEARRKLTASLAAHPDGIDDIRRADAARAALRAEFLPPARPVPHGIVSLGTHCYAASLLGRFGARDWSGPFDWIFSTPAMVRDSMRDRFDAYLDSTQYRHIPVGERADPDYERVSHTAFEARYDIPSAVFNHTDAHTAEGQDYLRRCVARFEAALDGPKPVQFLQVVPDKPGVADEFDRTLDALSERCAARPTLVQVIVGERAMDGVGPLTRTLRMVEQGRLLEFRPTSAWGATRFADLLDDLMLMRAVADAFAASRRDADGSESIA